MEIEVKKEGKNEFVVVVRENSSHTKHRVVLDDEYYKHLTEGNVTKEELIEKSFKFLLEHESKESILSAFNLRVIKTYFPQYEKEIRG